MERFRDGERGVTTAGPVDGLGVQLKIESNFDN